VDTPLEDVRRRAAADDETVGVLLIGSRATGSFMAGSDYDLIWVLTDEGMAARTEPPHVKDGDVDVNHIAIGRLRERIDELDWATGALITGQIVHDADGELAGVLAQIRESAGERARADVASAYDAYLNSYTRSLKAWRRGSELGGRMHAVESMAALARMLYGVAGRWPVYHDELERSLPDLERELGLDVLDDMRTIAETADPRLQQELETRVERFMTDRGFPHEWEDALDKLRQWRFKSSTCI
jgi:hypothetical protein